MVFTTYKVCSFIFLCGGRTDAAAPRWEKFKGPDPRWLYGGAFKIWFLGGLGGEE